MELVHKEEYYKIVGICMEVHKHLGSGLLEIVYKDALEYEFRMNSIPYQREKEYFIEYKDIVLPHKFYADFVVYEDIILEIKSITDIADIHIAQTLNYVKLVHGKLGIIINFNGRSLQHKRVVA